MYRAIFYVGLFLLVVSILGLIIPSNQYYITFMLPGFIMSIIGIILGIILIHFSVFSILRKVTAKLMFLIGGTILVLLSLIFAFTMTSVSTPDTVLLFAAGIGGLLSGVEYQRDSLGHELKIAYSEYFQVKQSKIKSTFHVIKVIFAHSVRG